MPATFGKWLHVVIPRKRKILILYERMHIHLVMARLLCLSPSGCCGVIYLLIPTEGFYPSSSFCTAISQAFKVSRKIMSTRGSLFVMSVGFHLLQKLLHLK